MSGPLRDVLTLDRARSAARAGDLDRAVRLLSEVEPSVGALDLRARVHAQRGEFGRADACWAEVLALDPGNADARRGRAAIAGRRPRRVLLAAFVAVAVVAGGVLWWPSDSPAPSALPTPSAPSVSPPAATPVVSPLAEIAAAFRFPGVSAQVRSEDVRLVFEAGLFSDGTTLNDSAGKVLSTVGRRLSQLDVTTTIVGQTVAIPGGRSSGGSPVAYARALVVAEHLAAASGLPLTAFTLTTAEQWKGPAASAGAHRTVTLLLTPATSTPRPPPLR